MNSRSRQAKGGRFENFLLALLRGEVDANAHRNPGSGNGQFKNDIRLPSLDIEIECKNALGFNLIPDWEQVKRQKTTGNMAVLALRHPRQPEFRETLVVLDLNDFIELLTNQSGRREVASKLDLKLRWDIQRMVDAGKKVIKALENA